MSKGSRSKQGFARKPYTVNVLPETNALDQYAGIVIEQPIR
jgi:hypothetical protein